MPKDKITKTLVTHSTDEVKEMKRCRNIEGLVDKETIQFSFALTPHNKYGSDRNTKGTRIPTMLEYSLLPYSAAIHDQNTSTNVEVSLNLNESIEPRADSIEVALNFDNGDYTGARGISDCSNNAVVTEEMTEVDDTNSTVNFRRVSDIDEVGGAGIDPIVFDVNSVLRPMDVNIRRISITDEDTARNRDIQKFGLLWKDSSPPGKQNTKDTTARKGKQLLTFLHDITSNDMEEAQKVYSVFEKKFKSTYRECCSSNGVKDQEGRSRAKAQEVASLIVSNMNQFINLSQLQGPRDPQTQQAILSVWTAMIGPTYGYCSTPYGGGSIVAIDKSTRICTVILHWNAKVYVSEDRFENEED